MPRSGPLGTYTLPGAQKTQQPNTVIPSAVNNQGYADIEQTFNTIQPIAYGGTGAGTPLGAIRTLLDGLQWGVWPVGSYYETDDVAGADTPPISSPDFAWVELTAGLTGSGQFNNGKLTSESLSGSAPLNTATAVVSLASSPMAGQTIRLLNTEGRYLKPSAASIGSVFNDQMQQITGGIGGTGAQGLVGATSLTAIGAIDPGPPLAGSATSGSALERYRISFDSANSPNARTGTFTDVKRQNVRVFRCIKNIWS